MQDTIYPNQNITGYFFYCYLYGRLSVYCSNKFKNVLTVRKQSPPKTHNIMLTNTFKGFHSQGTKASHHESSSTIHYMIHLPTYIDITIMIMDIADRHMNT